MKIAIKTLPDILDYSQYILSFQVASDVTVIMIFKQLSRSDSVLVDLYLNEIAEDTKIISGRRVATDCIISQPRYDIGFEYLVYCADIDLLQQPVTKYNLYNYYFQFVKDDGDDEI